MNKIILIFLTLLFSAGVFAKNDRKCDAGSLFGSYSYEVNGVNEIPVPNAQSPNFLILSTHVIGQVYFDGNGHAQFYGIGSAAGQVEQKNGTGTYKVDDHCIVQGAMKFDNYHSTKFQIVLDTIDSKRSPYLAYHGALLARDTTPADPNPKSSGAGWINKVIGKF